MKKENLFKYRKWLFTLLSTMILLLASASSSLALDASSKYPASMVSTYKGNTYQLVFERMGWDAANTYAKSIGGHLATITSADEENHIVSLIKQWRSTYKDSYWLGATDREEEGVWKWTTGESFQYTNWYRSQPDNGDWNDEHYLEIGRFTDDTWNDWIGDPKDSIGFIIEWEGTAAQPDSPAAQEPAEVKLNKTSIVLVKGKTCQLKLIGTSKKPKWKAAKKSIASISASGKVKARKAGTTKVRATLNGKKYYCKVKVEAPKLNKTKLSLKLGEKSTLKLKGTKQKVTWKSSKPSVVTVSQQGVVTAKQNGTARIVAKAGGVKFRCTITVKAKAVLSKEQATKAVRNYFAKEGWDYYFNGYEEKEGKYYTYFVTLRGVYTKFKYFVDTQTAKVYSTGPYRGIDEWKPSDPIYYRFNAYDYI